MAQLFIAVFVMFVIPTFVWGIAGNLIWEALVHYEFVDAYFNKREQTRFLMGGGATITIIWCIILYFMDFYSWLGEDAEKDAQSRETSRQNHERRSCSWCNATFTKFDSGYDWHCCKRCYSSDRNR